MKKLLILSMIIILIISVAGCGSKSESGGVKVSIYLKQETAAVANNFKVASNNNYQAASLTYEDVYATGKYATYITCEPGTNFNGGYAFNLNQRIGLMAKIMDSAGNPITNIDSTQIYWQNPDPSNIFPTYTTGFYTQLDIRKVGKYTISASYQGYSGSCQVIAYNATYAFCANSGDLNQGVIFNSDTLATQTTDLAIADLYISSVDKNTYSCIINAPRGIAVASVDTGTWIGPVYLYQFGNLKNVPEGLTYNTQITLTSNNVQTFILKKRDGSGYVKLAVLAEYGTPLPITYEGMMLAIVYSVSSTTSFPLSFD